MRHREQQRDDGQKQQPPRRHGRHQDGNGRNRRDLEAAQDVGLAILYRSHAGAPKPIAQDSHYENHAHEVRNPVPRGAAEQPAENEEKDERKNVVEEEDRAVPQGQLHVALEQGYISSHSRRLFPVSSMKASSSDGLLIRISASSMPFSSSHFMMSTMERAGRRETTETRVRPRSEEHTSEL